MKSQFFPLLFLGFLGTVAAHAGTPTHIVLLKAKDDTRTLSRSSSSKQRYAHARKVVGERTKRLLKPFINEFKVKRSLTSEVVYLPLISGVAMTLNPAQVEALKKHPAVLKIVPNEMVGSDLPKTKFKIVAPRTSRSLPQPNEGLVLHKVDKLMEMGVDIHRPGKVVGIIDTGIDGKHPDLADKILRFRSFPDNGTTPVDHGEHGTHVAGIVAGGKASGVQLGVYPGAKLIVAASSPETPNRVLDRLAALQWMLDPDENPATADQPFVINNSWHIGSADPTPFYTALKALNDADILVAFSAGNAGDDGITHPKEYPDTFTTASVDVKGIIASSSSWGPATFEGRSVQKPEVSSHGVNVMSTLPGGKYGRMSGTSMASPFTAGAVALLGAHFPGLSPFVIAKALLNSTEAPTTSRSTWHKQYGFGLLNVQQAYMDLKSKNP